MLFGGGGGAILAASRAPVISSPNKAKDSRSRATTTTTGEGPPQQNKKNDDEKTANEHLLTRWPHTHEEGGRWGGNRAKLPRPLFAPLRSTLRLNEKNDETAAAVSWVLVARACYLHNGGIIHGGRGHTSGNFRC